MIELTNDGWLAKLNRELDLDREDDLRALYQDGLGCDLDDLEHIIGEDVKENPDSWLTEKDYIYSMTKKIDEEEYFGAEHMVLEVIERSAISIPDSRAHIIPCYAGEEVQTVLYQKSGVKLVSLIAKLLGGDKTIEFDGRFSRYAESPQDIHYADMKSCQSYLGSMILIRDGETLIIDSEDRRFSTTLPYSDDMSIMRDQKQKGRLFLRMPLKKDSPIEEARFYVENTDIEEER